MDLFDEMIRAGLRRDLAGHQPPAKVREQVLGGRRRASSPHRPLAVGLVVTLIVGLAVLLPGPRAQASNWLQQVVEFVLLETGIELKGKVIEESAVSFSPGQVFRGGPGQLPPEGVAAAEAAGLPLLVPAWLPDDAPIRLDVVGNVVYIWIGDQIGEHITIRQMAASGSSETVGLPAAPELITNEFIVVGPEGARTEVQSHLSYQFEVAGVSIAINGPLGSETVLKQLAEGLWQE